MTDCVDSWHLLKGWKETTHLCFEPNMQQKAYVLMGHTHLDLHGLLQLRDALDSVSLLDAQMELSLQSRSEVLISLNLKYVNISLE